jgi:hypothetical protein
MRNLPLKSKCCQFVHIAGISNIPGLVYSIYQHETLLPLRRIELIASARSRPRMARWYRLGEQVTGTLDDADFRKLPYGDDL